MAELTQGAFLPPPPPIQYRVRPDPVQNRVKTRLQSRGIKIKLKEKFPKTLKSIKNYHAYSKLERVLDIITLKISVLILNMIDFSQKAINRLNCNKCNKINM